ncbi:MAG: hypothetical protein KAS23_14780, partial [Anaerohalosphaera sp.]|nr:hypothetical protein [Anaerohalosphaera sp.]
MREDKLYFETEMINDSDGKLDGLIVRIKRVRRWLIAISVLKLTAICLLLVSVYIGVYAWLDHRVHFQTVGRGIGLFILLFAVVYMAFRFGRIFLGHLSCSQAANHVESRRSFDQQLVAAVEYYEQQDDYPYSEEMAQRLVRQLDVASEEFRFDSTVSKWLAYLFVSIILLGLMVSSYFVRDNFRYFAQYASRLANPVSSVAPLPATSLESITKDITAEPGQSIVIKAAISGKIPELGSVVFAETDDSVENQADLPDGEMVEPKTTEDSNPIFEFTFSADNPGKFKYRFEADNSVSPWHSIIVSDIPRIKMIAADVSLGSNKFIAPYEEVVQDYCLKVIAGSFVVLKVEATEKLSRAVITDTDRNERIKNIENSNSFEYSFIAEKEGFVGIALTGQSGIVNDNIPSLQIVLKKDEPATLKLIAPGSDYLATNVASVPVRFELTDDFGLLSASIVAEVAGSEPVIHKIPIERGSKKQTITHTFELEEYDLEVGDSVMYYAEAADINTGSSLNKSATGSEVYFIEIRPYIQLWHEDTMVQMDGEQRERQGTFHEQLIKILEYTRAIVKKTWTLSRKQELAEKEKSQLNSINVDVRFCSDEVKMIRDDPTLLVSDTDKAVLNVILREYDRASEYLTAVQVSSALAHEKEAYRILRKFLIENDLKLCPPGFGSPPEAPDKVKIQEQVHLKRLEKERIESEIKQIAEQISKQEDQQERINRMFDHFLEQQQPKKYAQKTTDEKSWYEDSVPGAAANTNSNNNNSSAANRDPEPSVEGPLQSPPEPPEDAKSQGSKPGVLAGNGQRLKMLKAMQKDLQKRVSELKKALESLPLTSQANNQKREQTLDHIDQAGSGMGNAISEMGKSEYSSGTKDETLNQIAKELEKAHEQLEMARDGLVEELDLSEEDKLALEAQRLAEELMELAEKLETETSKAEFEKLLEK